MQINWKKEVLPHIYAIGIFLALAFMYCLPVLQGEQVRQGDMIQVEGMAHEAKAFYADSGQRPLWTNSMFSGMPSYMVYTGPSANKASFLNRAMGLWLPQPVNMLFIAMLGMYLLLAVLGFKFWIRLFGGVAYGFSSYNVIIIGVGHITKMLTMAWMAPLLAGVLLIYNRKYLIGAVVTTLSAMLLIYNNHYQIIYYTAIMLVALAIWRLIAALQARQLRAFIVATVICLGSGILAALPSLPHIMVTRDYAKYSIRDSQSQLTLQDNNKQIQKGGLDIDYAFQWSLGKLETFSILIPNIYGGPPHSQDFFTGSATYKQLAQLGAGGQQAAGITNAALYWGPQPFTTPIYFGAIICFLFILSLFVIRSRHKWWLLAVTLLAVMMAWGGNFEAFNAFLFHHLPLYNKFRTPSMTMVIPQLTLVLMACWALNDLSTGKITKKEALAALKKTLYVTVGLILLLWIIVGGLLGYTGPSDQRLAQQLGQQAMDMLRKSIHSDRASVFRYDAIRALFFAAAVFALLWQFLKDRLKATTLFALLGLLLIADLFVLDRRYLNTDNFVPQEQLANYYQPSPADQQILQDKSPDYRVLNLSVGLSSIFNDASTSYFHKSIGGYSPAKLWRYQDLIDHQLMPDLQTIFGALQTKKNLDSSLTGLLQSFPVLNMLNTKYFIVNPSGAPVINPAALGNAWFVDSLQWVPDANQEMQALRDFQPAHTAVLNASFKDAIKKGPPAKDSAAGIQLTQYGLNQLSYTTQNSRDGFGVFSEIYYPDGWKATIDGKEVPILRVNYLLRGLEIPAGQHKIQFTFHPEIFFKGQTLSGISSSVLILLILAGLGLAFYRSHRDKPAAS